ncbi:serine/threonine protein phosphatase 2A 57 kDa regulatory subunit B' alpha isoform-like [Typha latifolia]|uniref:serine/threonine protein phosphatase 2A 57 kDa regulatory subunit B' alpha isoform-like n=1 Tax=Typha latifolia TaxID=4733 RepID=UPI003C2FB16F
MGAPKTAPKAKKKSTTLRRLFDLDPNPIPLPLPRPPQSETEPEPESATSVLLSLISSSSDPFSAQETNRQTISQLLSTLRLCKKPLPDHLVPPLLSLLSALLFRPLPPQPDPLLLLLLVVDVDDYFPPLSFSPSWPHLTLIYDALSALLAIVDSKSLHSHITHSFLSNLTALLHSADPRERHKLKSTYHQLYSQLTGERAFMRKSMRNALLEADRHCGLGVAELLEIWGSIINGFVVPLKEEHKSLLKRVLMPLHKSRGMPGFYKQLCYCVFQFVEKEMELGEVVVEGMVRYWPVANCHKEVLMIGELEELVEVLDSHQFGKVAVRICSRIANCMSSCNSQVAERALYLWSNEQFVEMASGVMDQILPPIVEAIENNLSSHWSKSIHHLTTSVKKLLEEMEPTLYSRCLEEIKNQEPIARQEEIKRRAMWEMVEMAGRL